MQSLRTRLSIVVIAVAASAGAVSLDGFARQDSPASVPAVTERFAWLNGCWQGSSSTATYREMWTTASPDLMLGMSATVQPSKPAAFEFLRIVRANGRLAYLAQPGGVPPTAFTLSDLSNADLNVFANPGHDFPKRVVYQRVDANTLLAWIDGGEGARKVEYPMKRAANAASCLDSTSPTSGR